jgi:cathepsin A (carboxypeptidase C)
MSRFLQKQANGAVDGVQVVLDDVKEKVKGAEKLVEDEIKKKMSGKKPTVGTTSHGKVGAWNVHTLQSFPGKSLRIKEVAGLCDSNVKQYVGYLDVEGDADEAKHFFFWFFESRRSPAKDPVILWLNGGPGCSSMTGLFMELGPCRVNPQGNGTTINKWSWNNEANVIFLDQPINVGFSYGGGEQVSNTVDAADDVYGFLQLFFQTYPKYSNLDLHITGESYAGHYVPAIGKAIAEGNNYLKHDLASLKLKSLAIGNGLTDPKVQYAYYPDMACDNTYGPILDEATCDDMRSKYNTCRGLIDSCYKYKTAWTCVPGAVYCNNAMINPFQQTGLNIYDIREKCDTSKNPLCYEILTDIESYLNKPKVQEILGVDVPFEGCKRDINMKFMMAGDWMKPYVEDVMPLLEDGVKVLVYAGDADYICNWIGNKAWTLELEWSGKNGFNAAEDLPWVSKVTGKQAGEFRTHKGLTFLKVNEAGHMVPYDQPEHSSEFINQWISTKN